MGEKGRELQTDSGRERERQRGRERNDEIISIGTSVAPGVQIVLSLSE